MAYHLSPIFQEQQFDQNGNLLVGGKLYWYLAGTTTPATIYSSESGTAQSNPIVLNSRGEPDWPIWLDDAVTYKCKLTDSAGVEIRTVDDITGVNNTTNTTVGIEWTASGMTPTYLSSTQFSVAGDQRPTLQVSRRLRLVVSAGTIYGTITASTYAAGNTTVTVAGDTLSLDSGLSSFSYGTIAPTNSAIPETYNAGWGGTATGAVNAYAINVVPALGAYAAGQSFKFIPNLTNTSTTPTLNVNGLGAKTLKARSLSGLSAVTIGAIVAAQEIGVVYDGTYFVVEAVSSVSGSQTINYTGVTGSWTVPACSFVRVIAIGGGAGGTSGARDAAGTGRLGGKGGGGGERIERTFTAAELGGIGASVSYLVGDGGIGGPGRTVDGTSGIPGGDGGDTNFGTFLYAFGGVGDPTPNGGHYTSGQPFGGVGGTASAGGTGYWGGGGGGTGSATFVAGYPGGPSEYGSAGGGGGGGITVGNVANNGGSGGNLIQGLTLAASGGTGGTSGTPIGGNGATYAALHTGSGGGGGYASGGNGGNGGDYGGGGGGGGASLNGTTSGAGGNGGNGAIIVQWW